MRLQKLDIQGFKSFADRVTLHFGEGITGVVGPNGCGKSNIVDAIRWVMGEQSPRHLRGAAMQDVIFNGSDVRGPMGMAEVTLTFDNDGCGMPPEYAHIGEIQVTRRLYRDGDSDYEINKTPCRLKDITELFLGTGVGTRAYSIIQQGQVAEIMRVKPEDRRRIIEEAAGITKYKARKEAASRKMEATRQNLVRIDDVTKELNKRLGSLRRQAKKAEKYRELKSEARTIELHQAALRFFELRNSIGFEGERLDALNAKVADDGAHVVTLEGRIDAERASLIAHERTLGERQARIYEVDNGLALAGQAAEHALRDRERSQKRDEDAAVEVTQLQDHRVQLEAARVEMARGRGELDSEADGDGDALTTATEQLEEIRTRRNDEARQVERLRKAVMDRATEAAKASSDVGNLERSHEEMTSRREGLEGQRAQLTTERDLARDLGAQSAAEIVDVAAMKVELEGQREDAFASQQDARGVLAEAQRTLHEEKDALQKRKGRLVSLEELHARHEQSPESVRALLGTTPMKKGAPSEPAIIQGRLFADLFEAPPALELPLEAALGARLQAIVVEDDTTALTALAWLRAQNKGRAELVVESDLEAPKLKALPGAVPVTDELKPATGCDRIVRAVLGRILLVDDAPKAIALWGDAQRLGLTLVTRQGEVFGEAGAVCGGSLVGADSGVLRQKREIRELTREVAQREGDIARRTRAVDDMNARFAAFDEELRLLSDKLQSVGLQALQHQNSQRRADDDVQRIEQQLARLEGDERRLTHALATARLDLEAKRALILRIDSERASIEVDLSRQASVVNERDLEIAAHQERVTTLKVRASSIEQRRANLVRTLEQNTRSVRDVDARLERLAMQITEGHQERKRLEVTELEARAQTARLTIERAELKRVLDATRAACESIGAQVRMLDHEVRAARTSLDAAKKSHTALVVRVRELELELDAVCDRTIERHRATPQEVLHDFHMLPQPPADSPERLNDLERQIESLGAINLTAIDECRDIEKRYDFLKGQSDDLTHALSQLEKAILKINRTTKKRFQECFEGINERFQQVFPRLFRGGKAWLALTDPNDLLLTGVEIYAQPPGKKLGSIALMSGGEQALTAVSLIFAIFLLKPSPFCLLDEVDAPLDEANVGRFNEMVRDVSSISQFIVITHNKRTMEIADQLYGITMEEPGISKTVNVRMQ